jgi:hypothetical protein
MDSWVSRKKNSIYTIAIFQYQRVMEMRLEKELLLARSCVLRLPFSEDKQFSASNLYYGVIHSLGLA